MATRGLSSAPSDAVAHVVIATPRGEAHLERDDDHALAPIAAKHNGVLYEVSTPTDEKAEILRRTVLPLVRPVAIESFAVRGLDLSSARELPDALREGTGYRAMLAMASPPSRVVITGKVWSREVRKVVRTNAAYDRATAAFVFSEDEHHDLSRREMLKVAFAGRAVSPVTSYLATEPGVRPSTDGFDDDDIGLGGVGLIGHGAGGGGAAGTSPPRLSSVLDPAARRCAVRVAARDGWRVTLNVETTSREIVDVKAQSASDPRLARCIEEEIWATRLPAGSWPRRHIHTVRFDDRP